MIRIAGERVRLETMTREAYHRVRRAYVADPVMTSDVYVYDAGRVDAAFDMMAARAEESPVVGIFLEDVPIGELAFKRVDREKGRCELGIALANDRYKGQGYGKEAFALALWYAFEAMEMQAVYADTMGGNVRMQRILQGLGFVCFLRMEGCYDMGDRLEDRLDYRITREAYYARPRP